MPYNMAEFKNGPHHTDGHYYQVPSDPKMISALGRVSWSISRIEDVLACLLFDSGRDIREMRALPSGIKEAEFNALRSEVAGWGAPNSLLAIVEQCISIFKHCRKLYKDAIAIIQQYVDGLENEAELNARQISINYKQKAIKDAESLHRIAGEIESAVVHINTTRIALSNFWKAQLEQPDKFKVITETRHFLIKSEKQDNAVIFFTFVNGYGIFFRVNDNGDMKAVNPSRKVDRELLYEIALMIEKRGL